MYSTVLDRGPLENLICAKVCDFYLTLMCLSTHLRRVRTESVEGNRLSALVLVTWLPTILKVTAIPLRAEVAQVWSLNTVLVTAILW